MSQIRQRKRTTNNKDDDDGDDSSPPDLLECARDSDSSSSFEKYFDVGDGTSPNGYSTNNNNNNNSNTEKETTPLTKQLSNPNPNNTPTNNNNKLDKFLSTYGAFTSKTFTTDQALKILQWSSWAISYATRPSSTDNNNNSSILSPSLQILSSELSFTRYILRFFGFFHSLEGFRSGSWSGGKWDNPAIDTIAKYGMAGSMILYYPLEYVAYAGWKFPALKKKVDANKVSAVSCVFWTSYIIGDFWCSVLKWRELKDKLGRVREEMLGVKKKKGDDTKDAIANLPEEEVDLLNKIRHVKLQLVRCLLFILPAINWSLPNWATNPLLGELPLNGLMLAEAYTCVYQSLQAMSG
mmetsp:Transcript_3434/g.7489  ORF Transcript_3434/g.7489 Transcript_3434/m.7489 type:complete len:352 (-) Transcript_3434:302-1357(-)